MKMFWMDHLVAKNWITLVLLKWDLGRPKFHLYLPFVQPMGLRRSTHITISHGMQHKVVMMTHKAYPVMMCIKLLGWILDRRWLPWDMRIDLMFSPEDPSFIMLWIALYRFWVCLSIGTITSSNPLMDPNPEKSQSLQNLEMATLNPLQLTADC